MWLTSGRACGQKTLFPTSRDAKPTQHIEITHPQFKTGVLQGGTLSPTLFNIYTADIPPPRAPVQVMAYADDITITSTHTSTSAAKKYIQPYLHKVFAWTKTKQSHTKFRQNNLHSVHSRTCRIQEQSGPKNKQHCTTHGNAPKGSGPYLRPKTHIQHTHSQHLSTSPY